MDAPELSFFKNTLFCSQQAPCAGVALPLAVICDRRRWSRLYTFFRFKTRDFERLGHHGVGQNMI